MWNKRGRSWAIAAASCVIASQAVAQYVMPSDLELRSAYCLPILTSMLAMAQASPTEANKVAVRQDELRRLQAYLLPKLSTLDATSIALAMARGGTDMRRFPEAVTACGQQCGESKPYTDRADLDQRVACVVNCSNADPAVKRVQSCFPVNWLPF